MRITIHKWDDFQPRKDRKKHTWFRVDKDVMTSETLFGLTADQRWLWICLLAKACKAEAATFDVDLNYFATHTGLSEKRIRATIERLTEKGAIAFESVTSEAQEVSGNQSVTSGNRSVSTGITTNKQTDKQTNVQAPAEPEPEFDFESAYQKYPRKVGKSEGLKLLRDRKFSAKEFVEFSRAVAAYAAECRRLKIDEKYIKHFDTFVGPTRDKEPWRSFVTDPAPTPPPAAADVTSGGQFGIEDIRPEDPEMRRQKAAELRRSIGMVRGVDGKAGA